MLSQQEESRASRIFKKVVGQPLALIFGEANDIAVGETSLTTVCKGTYTGNRLIVQRLECNHFEYYQSTEGRKFILQWLASS